MTACRIRVSRDTPVSGDFEWATLGPEGAVLATGRSNLRASPVAGECEVVLASDLVLLDHVTVPAAQQRRLASALRFLVEDGTITDPERLHVAATARSGKDTVPVAVVDRQWLEELLAKLARAGLVAGGAYPECLLPALAPRAWTVVCNGSESFARLAAAEGLALDEPAPGEAPVALRLAVERARKSASAPERIVVRVAPGGAAPDLPRWSATLGVPVEAGPNWHWSEFGARPALDLLQGEFASRRGGRDWLRALRRPAMLAGALLLVGSIGIAADWAAKAHERRVLLEEMRGLYRATFGESAVVVDPPLQMTRALADLRRQAGQLAADDFLVLLGAVSGHLLDPAQHRIESISYGDGALSVQLRPHDPAQLRAQLERIRERAVIQGADIRAETPGPGGTLLLLRARPAAPR